MRPPRADDLLDVPDEDDRDFPLPASVRPAAAIDSDELGLEDEADHDVEAGHTGHKKIPTWQDAVGILIDANMTSRANSPDRGGHRGRRGGGRGR